MKTRKFGGGLTVMLVVAALLGATPAQAQLQAIYWTDRDNGVLFANDLVGGGNVALATGERLQDVDLNPADGLLYFADWGPPGPPPDEGSISRVATDGSGLALVLATDDAVHQLAIDGTRIYFTRAVSYAGREISHVETDGSGYTQLITNAENIGWFYSGLAVDPLNGLLYWGDIGVLTNNAPQGAVNVMATDGTGRAELEPHVDGRGRGFALHRGVIYLTAHDPQSPGTGGGIFSYDIATDTLTQLIDEPGTGFWDIEISRFEERMYFTNYAAGTIESARLDGTDRQVVLAGLTSPYGLALGQPRIRGSASWGKRLDQGVFSLTPTPGDTPVFNAE